jgi:hypothetical protein
MAFIAPQMWLTQLQDNFGELLSGGFIETYITGTSTPKATYTDATGDTSNANPVELDSAGRASVWLADDALYRFIVKTSAGVVLETVDAIGEVYVAPPVYPNDVAFSRQGDNLVTGEVHLVMPFVRDVDFPANFAGSRGHVEGAAPGANYTINVAQNGVNVGTIVIAASTGAFTFATTGGLPLSFVGGEVLTCIGATADAALSDWGFVLKGERA